MPKARKYNFQIRNYLNSASSHVDLQLLTLQTAIHSLTAYGIIQSIEPIPRIYFAHKYVRLQVQKIFKILNFLSVRVIEEIVCI